MAKPDLNNDMAFTATNYKLLLIGLAIVVVGFLLMSGGGNGDPKAFDESAIFSARRITVAPIVVLVRLPVHRLRHPEEVRRWRVERMSILHAIILAIIEGITEFLPISSTGHMIIGSTIMGIQQDEFVKLFTVAIQFGAILSVIVLYWKRFFQSVDFYVKLFVAFLPAVVFGLLLKDTIDMLLENILVVAGHVGRWWSGLPLHR